MYSVHNYLSNTYCVPDTMRGFGEGWEDDHGKGPLKGVHNLLEEMMNIHKWLCQETEGTGPGVAQFKHMGCGLFSWMI